VTTQATRPGPAVACLLCCRPVRPGQRRCPAFELAGILALTGCRGCAIGDPAARPTSASDTPKAAA
jgi:hypothetical protein